MNKVTFFFLKPLTTCMKTGHEHLNSFILNQLIDVDVNFYETLWQLCSQVRLTNG